MNVIIVRNKSGKKLNFGFAFISIALFIMFGFTAVNFYIATQPQGVSSFLSFSNNKTLNPGIQKTRQLINTMYQEQLVNQENEIHEVKEQSRENLTALSYRIAKLQAQVIRLESLGKRLALITKLDGSEFNFGLDPDMGGSGENIESVKFSEFIENMERIEGDIQSNAMQLRIMEQVLLTDQLKDRMIPSGTPGKNGWVSSHYGKRKDPFSGKITTHKGIDYAGKKGSDVIATADGIVVSTGTQTGYGKIIEIDHGYGISTRYGHNKKLKVKMGDKVTKGQAIASMGSSGRSTGPHVHYEVMRNGVQVNPKKFLVTAGKD